MRHATPFSRSPAPIAAADRRRALRRLLPLWPPEYDDVSQAGTATIVAKLRYALRCERVRGMDGHWTYDLARHVDLLAAYRSECRALAELEAAISHGACQGPSSLPTAIEPRHNSPRPSDNHVGGSTYLGTPLEQGYDASAGDVSRI